ncbi:RNA-directed DNA polymerase, eukaryota, reverse transcriptase zinc-binding domain protein [Tanacetum coccineum]
MESLHLSFQNVVNVDMFKGISVSSSLQLSHLFYADDVIFMGQWSESNINTIIQALDCFYKASGLHKSKLMGISVKDEVVSRAASKMGCSTLKTPFTYLGIKVGGSMARIRFIRALHGNCGGLDKRSKAAHTSVWKSITTEVNSLRNKGVDLLKFMNEKVGNGIDTSFWEEIWRGDMNFKTKFPRVYALESDKKINVASKMNHNDVGLSLRRAPRDGVEFEQFNNLNVFLAGTMLSDLNDRWSLSLVGSGKFLVASVRKLIDEHRLGGSSYKTRWIHMVPIKINILAWKVRYDFLPTRLNLSRRGIEIQSIICPSCNKEVESTNHISFACSLVRNIYRKIASWWDFLYVEFDSYESWPEWFLSLRMSSRLKNIMEGIFYVTWWLAILASSSEVPSVLGFLQRRKLEARKEVAASEFSHLNHSLSHRPVSVKPDISKASSAGGKLHILKPSCERNGITPTPKESLSPTSGSKVPNSPLTGESNLLIVKASAD